MNDDNAETLLRLMREISLALADASKQRCRMEETLTAIHNTLAENHRMITANFNLVQRMKGQP